MGTGSIEPLAKPRFPWRLRVSGGNKTSVQKSGLIQRRIKYTIISIYYIGNHSPEPGEGANQKITILNHLTGFYYKNVENSPLDNRRYRRPAEKYHGPAGQDGASKKCGFLRLAKCPKIDYIKRSFCSEPAAMLPAANSSSRHHRTSGFAPEPPPPAGRAEARAADTKNPPILQGGVGSAGGREGHRLLWRNPANHWMNGGL